MTDYSADKINHFYGVEHVRKRPGMYIGGTNQRALNHLAYILIDNAVEEAFIEKCGRIEVVLGKSGLLTVSDYSEGMPLEVDPKYNSPIAVLLLTELTYVKDRYAPEQYSIVGGLHGLGLAPVNALSESLTLEIRRDGFLGRQSFRQGKPTTPLEKIRPLTSLESTGTCITLQPDFTIFEATAFDFDAIAARCREVAYQVGELEVVCRDERTEPFQEVNFLAENGLLSMLDDLRGTANPLHEAIYGNHNVMLTYDDFETHRMGVDFAFQYTDSSETILRGYANTVLSTHGGTHIEGLKSGLWSHFNSISRHEFVWEDIMPGLIGIVGIRHPDPQFISPTKIILGNEEVFYAVSGLFAEAARKANLKGNRLLVNRIYRAYFRRQRFGDGK